MADLDGENAVKAILREPTGFSDPSHYESEIEIVGYCFGAHRDANGYGRNSETALAIFWRKGSLSYAPVTHIGRATRE